MRSSDAGAFATPCSPASRIPIEVPDQEQYIHCLRLADNLSPDAPQKNAVVDAPYEVFVSKPFRSADSAGRRLTTCGPHDRVLVETGRPRSDAVAKPKPCARP
jgi:hypothetical protein